MLHLPVEVLLLICHALEPSQRPRLLRVCRRLRSIFFQLVYSDLHLTGRRIDLLARTLQSSPEIAPTVQRLVLGDLTLRSKGPPEPSVGKPYYYSSWVRDRVQQSSHFANERDRWEKGLVLGMGDHWGALLLTLLENLVDLRIEYPPIPSYIRRTVLRAATRIGGPKPALQRLQRVVLELPDVRFLNPSQDLFPFFHLPSIRSVSARGIVDGGYSSTVGFKSRVEFDLSAPTSSTVEEINLECTCSEGFQMPAYITSCTNLKRFSFTNLYNDPFGAPKDQLLREEFYIPLLSQTNSLEVLNLNSLGLAYDDILDSASSLQENSRLGFTPRQSYDRWFGSFAVFNRLTELSIRAPNLLDLSDNKQRLKTSLVDTLPKSLESLFVSYSSEVYLKTLVDGLNEMLLVRKQKFPNLRKITVCYHETEMGRVFSHFEQLDGLIYVCKKAGVDFDLDHKERRAPSNQQDPSTSPHEVRPHRFLERDFSSWLEFEAWLHCRPSLSF